MFKQFFQRRGLPIWLTLPANVFRRTLLLGTVTRYSLRRRAASPFCFTDIGSGTLCNWCNGNLLTDIDSCYYLRRLCAFTRLRNAVNGLEAIWFYPRTVLGDLILLQTAVRRWLSRLRRERAFWAFIPLGSNVAWVIASFAS